MRLKFWERSGLDVAAVQPSAAPLSDVELPKKRRNYLGRMMGQMFKSSVTSENDRWTGTPTSPDSLIALRHSILVARSREQWSNNDYVRSFIRIVRQNVVGPFGVLMQSKAEKPRGGMDKEANAALELDWDDWGKKGSCDVTGKLSWRAIQCLAIETAARDGEFIVRLIYGDDAGPHGFAVQMIDPQRLSVKHDVTRLKSGGFIRHGIEFNTYGRPLAYHFTSTDERDSDYYTYNGLGFIRVPADQIIHEFVQELVGQRRGLPWASTSLFRLHHLQGAEDAAVQNARAGATKMGFIQWKEGFGPESDEDDDTPLHIDAEPLAFHELPEGAELAKFDPQYPSGEFAVFSKSQLRGASSGMGVPYNELANDLEGVNFSSIRQGTLDAREHYKELQQWLIESLCQPVRNAHLKWRLLSGAIKLKSGRPLAADKLEVYRKCEWQPRRWEWIDPRADSDANISSIRAGLKTISQVIRDQGRDPEVVFKEFADDIKAMKSAGISDEVISLFLMGEPPKPEKGEAGEKPKSDKPEDKADK